MFEYRVIEIVDEKTILVNYGTFNGAKRGDKVIIYRNGREVFDPETNESLGTWDIVKAHVTVVEAFEKFSVCKDERVTPSSVLNPLATLDLFASTTTYETLPVNKEQITKDINPSDVIISVGDSVRVLND